MRLRPRLTLFTILLVVTVVVFISILTLLTLRFIMRQEKTSNHLALFKNFSQTCQDALYIGDDLGIKVFSESLENSVPGLSFAIFVDRSRGARFEVVIPAIAESTSPEATGA